MKVHVKAVKMDGEQKLRIEYDGFVDYVDAAYIEGGAEVIPVTEEAVIANAKAILFFSDYVTGSVKGEPKTKKTTWVKIYI